jgi:hypothetical protein
MPTCKVEHIKSEDRGVSDERLRNNLNLKMIRGKAAQYREFVKSQIESGQEIE